MAVTTSQQVKNTEKISPEELKKLPQNIEAEQSLLGALLVNNEAIIRVADYLNAEHFFEPVHRRIYDAISRMVDKGQIASPTTLKTQFDHDPALEDQGGAVYLQKLVGLATSIINLETYGRIIYDLALKRQLINIGENLVNTAFDPREHSAATEQIESGEQQLFQLASQGNAETGFRALKVPLNNAIEIADLAHKRTDKLSGIKTDFSDLDTLLGGLQNSDLLILAGRPSMGKTALSINLAVNACKSLMKKGEAEEMETPPSVGFFSLEMSSEQLAARMIAMEAAVDSSRMRVGMLNDDEFAKIVQANVTLHNLPFYIDDTPALSISAVRTRARRLKRRHNLGLLIIDYLQLLRGSQKSSEGSRVQEVSEITQGLKAIAKELNIPVIALSQLSRAVEQRDDKRPQLSDLRESGSIEQDADVVMFIYREEYYLGRKMPPDTSPKFAEWQEQMNQCMNKTEVIIAKQRNGPIGTANLFFDANTTKFKNFAEDYPDTHPY